ncbi:unnamed protein product [Orchesella dallaii]|uniref:Odorant receptor n=1 Tax=Orchesella dallaii TaxID=48710 RepID=A0ABP1RAW9_9HEXA
MSLTKGSIRTQLLLQKYSLSTPCQISAIRRNGKPSSYVSVTPRPFQSGRFARRIWKLWIRIFIICILINLWHLRYVVNQYKKSHDNVEEIIAIIGIQAIQILRLSTYTLFEKHASDMSFVMTELFKLVQMDNRKVTERCCEKKELAIYAFGLSFLAFPAALGTLPLIRDYVPITQLILTALPITYRNEVSKKIIMGGVSLFNLIAGCHSAGAILFLILMCISIGDCTIILSSRLKLMSDVTILRNEDSLNRFRKCLRIYRLLQILTSISCDTTKYFFGMLVASAAIFNASCAYFAIFEQLPFFMYVASMLIVILDFAINFLLVGLASIPNKDGKIFTTNWRGVGVKKIRMELRSCSQIGFAVGMISNVTATSALSIADIFLNSIATLALMG